MACEGSCDWYPVGPVQTENGTKTLYVCNVCGDQKLR